jgi:hypothetical protein
LEAELNRSDSNFFCDATGTLRPISCSDSGRKSEELAQNYDRTFSQNSGSLRKDIPDLKAIAHTCQGFLWETSSESYRVSWLIIKQTESSGIPKIFMVENLFMLCDHISGFSTSKRIS